MKEEQYSCQNSSVGLKLTGWVVSIPVSMTKAQVPSPALSSYVYCSIGGQQLLLYTHLSWIWELFERKRLPNIALLITSNTGTRYEGNGNNHQNFLTVVLPGSVFERRAKPHGALD